MNELHQGIITLLKSAITGECLPLPEGFDLSQAYHMVRAHHMSTLIYAGAVNCGIPREHPAMQKLFQRYCKAMMISERQMQQLSRLYEAFERHQIDYMPLKGSMMKALYPKPELRMMGDADILIRQEQYPQIVPIVQACGLAGGDDEDHHYVWRNGNLCLELHKYLIASKYPELHAYFGNGWSFARPEEGSRYAMSVEDTFVFLFAHFSKHFGNAGIGCRHVTDLWVYLRAHPEMDDAAVRQRLSQLGLDRFYLYIRHMLDVWFAGAETDERTECLTEFIMSNGSWGNMSNAVVALGLKESGQDNSGRVRVHAVLRWIYPGADVLRKEYPVLKKAPVLLPVMACVRLVGKVFSKEARQRKIRDFSILNQKNIDKRREMMRVFGLDEHV